MASSTSVGVVDASESFRSDFAIESVVGAARRRAMFARLDLDYSAIRETIHHVRTLKAELASLGAASVSVRYSGFGTHGDQAPGAVRAALNGCFGSDGRAFT